jgi:deoxyribose-phosphate aldolase
MKNMPLPIEKGTDIAPFIDHTLLKPGILISDVEKICHEAIAYQFAAVCIPPLFVKQAVTFCKGSNIKVATVVGFPFGYSSIESKIAEIVLAMVDGVDELDVVINFTAIKNNDWELVANEINHIISIVKSKNTTLKTIIESGVLTPEEIIRCCDIYGAAGVDFVKTSTGYADVGARIEDVQLIRKHLADDVAIKASGGIRTYDFAKALIEAGATRIGCSAGVAIVNEQSGQGNY